MRYVLTLCLCCVALNAARAGDQEECHAVDNFDRAIPACTRILESPATKKDFVVWSTFNRAAAYERKGEFEKALADYNKVLQLEPQYLLAHYGRGVSYLRKGELVAAKSAFDNALALNPEFIEALYSRGIVHFDLGMLDKATVDFDATIALNAAHAAAFSRRGMVYEKRGDFPKAIADYRKALATTPSGNIHQQAHAYSRSRLTILGAGVTGPIAATDEKGRSSTDVTAAIPKEAERTAPKKEEAKPPPVAINLGRRVALVIGNTDYKHTDPLTNPRNDAVEISAALRRIGFQEVIEGTDLDVGTLAGKVRDFSRVLKGADLAFFYYAGHGIQVNGLNYMMPVDARLADESDVHAETIELNDVLKHMERQAKTNIVILDACRNNPLAGKLARSSGTRTRSGGAVGQGLAEVRSGIGTLIVFATEPGNVALDGADKHSPFTAALLKHIETPNTDIAIMLRRVRDDVIDSTKGRQVPWEHSSLRGAPIILKAGP
jgi:tetratricopeptide (TPR) repeat protein